MKMSHPKIRFSAYFAAIAAVFAFSLFAIFHFEVSGIRHQPVPRLSTASADYGKLPLSFQENLGQTDSRVRFVSRGSGYELFLRPEEAVLVLRRSQPAPTSSRERARSLRGGVRPNEAASVLRVRFAGANSAPEILGTGQLPGRVDYFIGNDQKKWLTNVPSYTSVHYRSIYPGVDLVFYGNQRRLEYDFVLSPEADPKSIALEVAGASSLRLDAQGNLVLGLPAGEVRLCKPVAYQETNGARHEIAVTYALTAPNRFTFVVSDYDRSLPLIVDPVLAYSTYLGGASDDMALAIAVDSTTGNAFVAGQTMSTDFPTTAQGGEVDNSGFSKAPIPAGDAANGALFVTEMNSTGTALVYSAYLSGDGSGDGGEVARGIAIDSMGNIYITGQTFSTNFPINSTNAVEATLPTGTTAPTAGTAFVTKITPGNTTLPYSSYLGGPNGDSGNAIAVDTNGNVYVTGITFTQAPTFPIMNPFQNTNNDTTSGVAFVTKINSAAATGPSSLVYSTFLGGDGKNASSIGFGDEGFGIAVDSSSNAYIVGTTTSDNFPTQENTTTNTPVLQTAALNTTFAAFVSRIDTTKTGNPSPSLIYSTYLSGEVQDAASAAALGPNNVVYATGATFSKTKFPITTGAFQTTNNSSLGVAFITLIDTNSAVPAGSPSALKYSTFFGGTGGDLAFGIQADAQANAYIAGGTSSLDFPVSPGAFQKALAQGAAGDPFLAKLSPQGNGQADRQYASYFGGSSGSDVASAIAIDSASPPDAFIAGQTFSANTSFPVFPPSTATPPAFQTSLDGTSDAFIAKLSLVPRVSVTPTSINFGDVVVGQTSMAQTVTVMNNTSISVTFNAMPFTFTGANPGDFAAAAGGATPCGASVGPGASCTENITFSPTVTPPGPESATLDVNDSDSSSPQTVALSGTGTNVAPDFTVMAPATFSVAQGSSGMFNVTVTPVGGFNQTVTLTCSGEPQFSTCGFAHNTVTLTDGVTPVMDAVTITTDVAPTMGGSGPPLGRTLPPALVALGASMLGIGFLIAAARRRYRIALGVAAVLVIFIGGCGSGHHNRTPLGTTTLTITGTSGNTMHTAQVMVTVTAP